MSKTTLPRAPWPWADPLWWARQQVRAATYIAHIMETAVRASLALYGDAARVSVHTLAPESAPWGAWGIATATSAAPASPVSPVSPVRETPPMVAEPPVQPVNGLNGRRTAEPKPELMPVPPAAELVVVPAAPGLTAVTPGLTAVTPDLTAVTPDLTAVTPEPQPAAAPAATPAGPAEAPVPGWDELTLGSIRARLRWLSGDDLVALHDWEEGHHARADVLSMLVNRLAKIRSANKGA